MDLAARIARETRYLSGLARTLWRIREIAPGSPVLVCDDFENAVDRFGDHTAIIFEGQSLSYRHLEALANRFAAWAEAQSLKRGDTVALLLPNRIEYIACWMGLAKRGIACALINNNLTGAALAHCLSISNASHVITDSSCLEAYHSIRFQLARPLTLWSIDEKSEDDSRRLLDLKNPALAPTRPDRAVRAGLTASDVALYIYTSGTTGMPKAARITHMRAQLYMRAFAGATGSTAQDRLYCALPLYHSTGGLCGAGAALLNGGTIVLRRKFSASHFWDDVALHGCTLFVYIGELCRYLVNTPPHALERAHKLRLGFGNGLRPDVWRQFQERFAIPRMLEFYGSTEGNVSLFNFDGQPGAVGRVPPYLRRNFQIHVVKFDIESETPVRGPDGFCSIAEPGEAGEAIGLIGTDARHNYSGYADKAASEKKILRNAFKQGDSWFRTGDLMRQDNDGYFYFVDRIGDTFRWKGENVSTTEVEQAISLYPGVAEANVYGVAISGLDGRAGMAAITPEPNFNIAGLRDHLAQQLPSFARPMFVRIQPQIETTGTFKYRKVDLVKEGFDPGKTEHQLYFDHPDERAYVRIDDALYRQIESGAFKL